ncbi:MAG: hypothetical protein WKF94_10615 [Solirubrobacteraceae bacterium]
MPQPARAPRLEARFDELLFREDLAHATRAGQAVAAERHATTLLLKAGHAACSRYSRLRAR